MYRSSLHVAEEVAVRDDEVWADGRVDIDMAFVNVFDDVGFEENGFPTNL